MARIRARQRTSGLKANLDVADDKGTPLQAGVDFTDNAVNAQSGTIELRATFANGDLSLIPGQLVNINVELDNIKNALVVPRDAISDGPNGSYVYEVQDGKAVQHSVKILFDDTKSVAVEGDIKAGDKVVIEGQLRIVPGGALNVMPARNDSANAGGVPQ